MSQLRLLSIFGTRPEAVKMAPVVNELARTPGIDSHVCVTAQHREMLDQVLELFGIVPDVDLDLMRPNQSLAEITAAVFTRLDPVLERLKPDWVLVQGDTTTVMAAALLAYYQRVKVGHVEAGLRTGDKYHPFPEEINRQIAGVVADLHFAPTTWSQANLLRENIPSERIIVTGNPVIDALHMVADRPAPPGIMRLFESLGISETGSTSAPQRVPRRIVTLTAHRRENFGSPFENIFDAVTRLSEIYGEKIQFVYPVHLNPNVQEPAHRLLGDRPNITLIDPLDYLSLVHLLRRSTLLLTDSGGLQEEAPGLGVPTLVLRDLTERPEGVEAGTLLLVGTDSDRIVAEVRRLLDDPVAHQAMSGAVNPYGDGHAATRIVKAILDYKAPQ